MQLLDLKKEFEKCQREITHYHFLLEQREQALQKMEALKEEVEAKLIQLHQLMKKNRQAPALEKEISMNSEQIAAIKKTMQKIDVELDQIGEEKEVHFEEIQKALVLQIQEAFPEASQEYQNICLNLKEAHQRKEQLLHESAQIAPLFHTFAQAGSIQFKRNIFDLLRGKHPKSLLARALHHAYDQAKELDIKEIQLKHFVEKFLQEAKDPWNHELQRKKFPKLYEEFSHLVASQNQQIAEQQLRITTLEASFLKWIDKYTKNRLD